MITDSQHDGQPLTTQQAARELDVSVDRVRQLARSGRLPFTDTPYGRLFDPAGVAGLLAQRSESPTGRHDPTGPARTGDHPRGA